MRSPQRFEQSRLLLRARTGRLLHRQRILFLAPRDDVEILAFSASEAGDTADAKPSD